MQITREPVGCTALHCIYMYIVYILYIGAVTFASAVGALYINCLLTNTVGNHAMEDTSCLVQHHLREPQLLVAF